MQKENTTISFPLPPTYTRMHTHARTHKHTCTHKYTRIHTHKHTLQISACKHTHALDNKQKVPQGRAAVHCLEGWRQTNGGVEEIWWRAHDISCRRGGGNDSHDSSTLGGHKGRHSHLLPTTFCLLFCGGGAYFSVPNWLLFLYQRGKSLMWSTRKSLW